MTRSSLSRLALAIPAALLACLSASLPRAPPPDLYALDAPPSPGPSASGGTRTPLVVAEPRAAPGLEGRGMVYVQREHQIRYFARSAWVDAPGHMLAPLLARALEAGGAFQVVRDAASDAPARLQLESDLLSLQQEFTVRPSQVRLALRVRLVDAAARRVLGERELEVVEPARSDDPYGGVVAANAAAARALAEVAELCAGWARGASPAAGAGQTAR
jgi:cholesterol transport system auxiliary component